MAVPRVRSTVVLLHAADEWSAAPQAVLKNAKVGMLAHASCWSNLSAGPHPWSQAAPTKSSDKYASVRYYLCYIRDENMMHTSATRIVSNTLILLLTQRTCLVFLVQLFVVV